MDAERKPIVWLHGEVKTPPFTKAARLEVRVLLARLQEGEKIGMPQSRPMPNIGARCHELRVRDENKNWRIIYRLDEDAIIIAEVFNKATRETPEGVMKICKKRLSQYDDD